MNTEYSRKKRSLLIKEVYNISGQHVSRWQLKLILLFDRYLKLVKILTTVYSVKRDIKFD